jgi:hypothetical protein
MRNVAVVGAGTARFGVRKASYRDLVSSFPHISRGIW